MKKFITLCAALAALVCAASLPVTAAPKPTAIKCPSCGMMMPTHKTSMMTVPVYCTKSKVTVYCCPMCPSGKAAAAYWKAHHKAMSAPL